MKKPLLLLTLLLISFYSFSQKAGSSQDSLLNSLSSDNPKEPVTIFKSTLLVLSQTTETVKKNNLNFLVIHRFGDFAGTNGGGQIFYGLDAVADVYIGFEYGITDKLNIDLGRSTIGRLVNMNLKYALLQQTTDNSSPLAITLVGETGVRTYDSYHAFSDRVSYFAEAIFARKFSSEFSLLVAPSFVRDNTPIPFTVGNTQHFLSLSAAARFKITKHMGFIIDYAHPFSSFRSTANGFHDPLGFGLEMETGGHVFTINFTNSRAISEINYLSNTQSAYSKGEYRIGFTISRMFDFNHKKQY
ncbi:DUF5777 family beta-barrel protein [Mucilaginibacter sp.]|uniref:DUF5777 family beta-barrel protein n=1 Tax=Mucilaginibacter sp. TaxID=1882438 RepID=UPI002616F8F4|nr:DUF5777 family beta-barrel protein [Mucilaginibacter sp.]MDB4926341.1 hypothetical protein [Mucilaginibacter sp.]